MDISSSLRRRAAVVSLPVLVGSLVAPTASAKQVVTYSTFFASAGISDHVNSVVVAPDGSVVIGGSIDGEGLPVTEGAFQTDLNGGADGFVARFSPAGELVFSTYFGGGHHDSVEDVAIAPDGSIYATGVALSDDLPVTDDAYQSTWKGNVDGCEFLCVGDAFVARFSEDGSDLLYSTFFGGDLQEVGTELYVDDQGRIYLAGFTSSPDLPTTPGVFDPVYNAPTCFDQCDADVFVARFDETGTTLELATFFGGSSWDSVAGMDVDGAGNIFIAGPTRSVDLAVTDGAYQSTKNGNGDFDFNGFVASFSPEADELRYGTYLGARPEEQITALDVEPDGTAWVTGFAGRNHPTTADALQPRRGGHSDAFVTAFSPDGAALEYSTYFGGSRFDSGRGIAIVDGFVHLTGGAESDDLPTRRATQSRNAGQGDLFYLRFEPGAPRAATSTYLGGERFETATDLAVADGSVYVSGSSESRAMPLAGAFVQGDMRGSDGILVRLSPDGLGRSKLRSDAIDPRSFVSSVGHSTIRWANATVRPRRIRETGVSLFDSRRRIQGAHYYFTFPAGRFNVVESRSEARQRVAIAPLAARGDLGDPIDVEWARVPLGKDFVFDVQIKRGAGSYEMLLEGTTDLRGSFDEVAGEYAFRARVRNLTTGQTSGWSPPALLGSAG